MKSIAVASAAILGLTSGERVSYSGHQVIRCGADTRTKLDLLNDLTEKSEWKLDFWREPRQVNVPVDIMVNSADHPLLTNMLLRHGVNCTSFMPDVGASIDREAEEIRRITSSAASSYHESYHDWKSVHQFIEGLAAEFPSMASVSTIGTTYLGKPMKVITMSTKPGTKRPTLFYDGGLHAREWIAVSVVTYVAETLLRGYGSNADATYILDNFDVVIAPILNVDGYDYTWTTDRMWRKTLTPNGKSPCLGTDPNRNWEFHWGEAGASTQPCSDSYQGPKAASEVEVQAIQKYLYNNKDVLKGYVNFHSYEQLWMSNWGYTSKLPPDYEQQNGLSAAVAAAIKATHGKVYEYGPIATTIYPASGSSADYTYGVCGIKYSYGAELRDTGEYGFILPTTEIIPNGEEIFAGIVAMAKYIQANP